MISSIKRTTAFEKSSASLSTQRRFTELKQLKIRIGTLDLRIAAITLARNAVLVTRNHQDFVKVPDLTIEDWSIPENVIQ